MNEQYELLWQCYKSGQISEKQWQEHLKEDPDLVDYLRTKAPKDF